MAGVHARFPPKADIRPGVYAGFHATARVSAPSGGGREGAGSKGRTGQPVLKHGPHTADAEKGRERPRHRAGRSKDNSRVKTSPAAKRSPKIDWRERPCRPGYHDSTYFGESAAMAIFLGSVLFALSISAFCSLMEATLLSLTPSQVAEISDRRPQLGHIWQQFKSQIDRPIAVILIINTAAHTIGATVAGAKFDQLFGDRWIWLFSLVFTFLMLQFTEILPKTLGVRNSPRIAVWMARPLQALVAALHPVIQIIRWINRPFEGDRDPASPTATPEEIAALAGLARLSRQITAHQERIIRGGSRLSRLVVSDVMIPTEEVSVMSSSQSLSDAVLAAHMDAHTRYPICEEGDPNRIIGYVNFKEMIYSLRTNPRDATLHGISRPVRLTDPNEPVATLLKAFVDEHAHMAIVQNQQGLTLGMVTLEDLVEELVGELEDEFDRLPRMLHSLGGQVWMIGGGVRISDVNQSLELSLPEPEKTLSEWLEQRLSDVPRPGDACRHDQVVFTVRRVRRRKVFEASVQQNA